jgi:DNA polymerase-1
MNKDLLNKLFLELKSDKNSSKNARVLIVDSMNTFLRSFSIIQHLNPDGHHVGGLTGYLKSVGFAVRSYQPTRVFLVFDGQGNSTNKKYLYADYKANRQNLKVNNWKVFSDKEEESESMANQMGRLIEYLSQLPVSIIMIPKIEADDVIGYLVEKFESDPETDNITIMSADQDFLQLVSDKTEIYSPTKKKTYHKSEILNEYLVHANNYINMKLLLGDSGDNVPGVDGLGPKKLLKLYPELQSEQFLTVDDLLNKARVNESSNQLYTKILHFESQLRLNERLMSLKNVNISDEDKYIIDDSLEMPPPNLNVGAFLEMTELDHLNERINWQNWLIELFSPLNWNSKNPI